MHCRPATGANASRLSLYPHTLALCSMSSTCLVDMQVIKAGYASCTGLSIFLVNALRAVGIPARMAGGAELKGFCWLACGCSISFALVFA